MTPVFGFFGRGWKTKDPAILVVEAVEQHRRQSGTHQAFSVLRHKNTSKHFAASAWYLLAVRALAGPSQCLY